MNCKRLIWLCLLPLFAGLQVQAVSLPAVFGSHMVLQQNATVQIRGWGKPFEKITLTTGWNSDTLRTVADNQANWALALNTPAAGGPYSIRIEGYNTLVLDDVLIGEVWLLSGQSNMEWTPRAGLKGGEDEVKNARNRQLRLFVVTHRTASSPNYDIDGRWMVCSPEAVMDFSAVGFFFGNRLQEQLQQPVGLVCSAWGGTPVEAWTPADSILTNDRMRAGAEKLKPVPWGPVEPGRLYNAMIAPMMPLPLAGMLWYQGEGNTENPDTYEQSLKTMIRAWRAGFGSAFAFYFAQIAPLRGYPGESGVEIRDAQRRVLSEPNTGMVVTADVGDTLDIHPRNKVAVGNRLADLALNRTYGKKEFAASGPLFAGFKVEKQKVIVWFDEAEGLHATAPLTGFEVAGADGVWHRAKAEIKNNTVVLVCSRVKEPLQVRFDWKNACFPALYNAAGLPASSFTSVAWMK